MERHPGLGVGLMSGADDPTLGRRAQDTGLVAYLPKTLEIPALLAQLRQLAEGEPAFADAARAPHADQAPTGPYGLTVRQVDGKAHAGLGWQQQGNCARDGHLPRHGENHLNAIFTKIVHAQINGL